MRIVLAQSTAEAVQTVVTHILDKISLHPASVIGLATGKTMEPVYKEWVAQAKEQKINHEKVFFFMLDEYLGLAAGHPSSFKSYIEQRLLKPLDILESQIAFPPIQLVSSGKAGEHYEQLLIEAGGVDLQLLGLGKNGHIGFNEPGSSKDSLTRVVKLAKETIETNKIETDSALSMGIGTIMKSRELLMLVTGKSKAEVIKYLFNHHDDESCPVTFLKSHPHFTLVLDPEAASNISLKI